MTRGRANVLWSGPIGAFIFGRINKFWREVKRLATSDGNGHWRAAGITVKKKEGTRTRLVVAEGRREGEDTTK